MFMPLDRYTKSLPSLLENSGMDYTLLSHKP